MFYACTSLVNPPSLSSVTQIDSGGCGYMFEKCTSITAVTDFPSIVGYTSYYGMFSGCTGLVNAPELPATTLAYRCYFSMFDGCSNLITAPVLPATTLESGCYNYMFRGCGKLNYIKAMFTTTPSTSYTNNWVSGVAASGTFVKNSAATWTTTGAHGVPTGWDVQTASS